MTAIQPAAILRLLLSLCLLSGLFAPLQLRAETTAGSDTGKPFATVWRIRGDVFAGDKARKLGENDVVMVGETVRAAANGEAVLKTSDAGMVAIRPNAEFIAERYAADGKASDHQVLRLMTGALRLISGKIAQINRNDHRVVTPNAVIGIRGTDHEPYVLPLELATPNYLQGTYDKVNSGATSLEANGGEVVIEPGQVGFSGKAATTPPRSRGLTTLLLPTLLAKVPDFYVPGAFDAELDRYAAAQAKLPVAPPSAESGRKKPGPNKMAPNPLAGCSPEGIARYWLFRFDDAVAGRDIKTVLALFAPDVVARATVRNSDNTMTTVEFQRDELVQSTLKALSGLKDYRQRRLSLEARLAEGENETSCQRIRLSSRLIEEGRLNGKPHRFESTEDYLLELRNGEWLATQANSIQH